MVLAVKVQNLCETTKADCGKNNGKSAFQIPKTVLKCTQHPNL